MNNDKVDEALRAIIDRYKAIHDPKRCLPHRIGSDQYNQRCHLLWMANEMLTWGPERLEKKFRWLGFMQGVMWSIGDSNLEALKSANRPESKPCCPRCGWEGYVPGVRCPDCEYFQETT